MTNEEFVRQAYARAEVRDLGGGLRASSRQRAGKEEVE